MSVRLDRFEAAEQEVGGEKGGRPRLLVGLAVMLRAMMMMMMACVALQECVVDDGRSYVVRPVERLDSPGRSQMRRCWEELRDGARMARRRLPESECVGWRRKQREDLRRERRGDGKRSSSFVVDVRAGEFERASERNWFRRRLGQSIVCRQSLVVAAVGRSLCSSPSSSSVARVSVSVCSGAGGRGLFLGCRRWGRGVGAGVGVGEVSG